MTDSDFLLHSFLPFPDHPGLCPTVHNNQNIIASGE